MHARGGGCALQGLDVLYSDWRATVGRTRGLALRDGLQQRIGSRGGTRKRVPLGAVLPDRDGARPATGGRSDNQVLHRAPEADEQMVVVRIDGGCRARQVRQDVDGIRTGDEAPWLGVVAVGRQRRIADEILDLGTLGQRLPKSVGILRIRAGASCRQSPCDRRATDCHGGAARSNQHTASLHGKPFPPSSAPSL